jgi:aminoglycoside 6'-N-acetyltransferase
MTPPRYVFRPMTRADLPLVRRWLAAPHVSQWWGDADEQFDIVRLDLDEPAMQQYIVSADGRLIAYLQCYDPNAWPDHPFGQLPLGARGLDPFVGEADMIDRGHGSAFLRAFVDELFAAGTPCAAIDPAPVNLRAVRAYEKAGFRKERMVNTPDGPTLLMVRTA